MSELELAQERVLEAERDRILAVKVVVRALAQEMKYCNEVTKARMALVALQDTLNYEI